MQSSSREEVMRRKIPSIEALIAFEAAARHQSFTRSADELALTQSAVGRQIAILEEYLGVPLFNRVKKRISLTDVGTMYARQVRESLEKIERDTLGAMAHQGAGGILELAVIPTFATRWLIPRLPEFYAQHAHITLNLTTRAEPFMFTDTPFDAAIHFGNSVWPGAVAHHLFGEEMTPVCSPRLLNGSTSLRPEDLENFTLLHQSARPGLGIALVPRFFVLNELAGGELLIPCDLSLRNDKGYYLVYPECKQSSVLLMAFEKWLLETAQQYREAA